MLLLLDENVSGYSWHSVGTFVDQSLVLTSCQKKKVLTKAMGPRCGALKCSSWCYAKPVSSLYCQMGNCFQPQSNGLEDMSRWRVEFKYSFIASTHLSPHFFSMLERLGLNISSFCFIGFCEPSLITLKSIFLLHNVLKFMKDSFFISFGTHD